MHEPWDPAAPGVVRLPSGRLVRGRALRRPVPAGPAPQWALHLLRRAPPPVPWPSRWLRWPDFRVPADEAVRWAREQNSSRAVETPWQRRWVARWSP